MNGRTARELRRVLAEVRIAPVAAGLFFATWERELARLGHRERGRILALLRKDPMAAVAWALEREQEVCGGG